MGRTPTDAVDHRHRHLTDGLARRLPGPPAGQREILYRDTQQPSLGLRVTASGARSWFAEVWFRAEGKPGRSRRETIGRIHDFTVDQARERAAKIRTDYKHGTDRRAERKRAEIASFTLREAMEDFLDFKVDRHKSRTQDDIRSAFDAAFSDWLDKPMLSITEDMVLARHIERTKQGKRAQKLAGRPASGARADLEFRYLRAVWNHTRAAKRIGSEAAIPEAPTRRLSELDAWNPKQERTRTLEPDAMRAWHAAVMAQPEGAARDWFLFIWLTGLRSTESREIRWEHVDQDRGAMLIVDPKNRETCELPVTPAVRDILDRRLALKVNDYVFPDCDGAGPLSDSSQAVRAVCQVYGRPWSPHDCRASFMTAGAKCRVHPYMIRRLTNHKLPSNDAHGRYFRPTLAEKRDAAEAIQRYLLRQAGAIAGTVVPMRRKMK